VPLWTYQQRFSFWEKGLQIKTFPPSCQQALRPYLTRSIFILRWWILIQLCHLTRLRLHVWSMSRIFGLDLSQLSYMNSYVHFSLVLVGERSPVLGHFLATNGLIWNPTTASNPHQLCQWIASESNFKWLVYLLCRPMRYWDLCFHVLLRKLLLQSCNTWTMSRLILSFS
jgi:hypothetical protein